MFRLRWWLLKVKRFISATEMTSVTFKSVFSHNSRFGICGRRSSGETGRLHEDAVTHGTAEIHPALDRTVVFAWIEWKKESFWLLYLKFLS